MITLEARPPNIEGQGEIRIRELVRNSLRMRPDRIIVGEVRGAETLDMLQAMNTGHEGSLTTIHANSPRDALSRLETLVLTAGVDLPLRAIREQISSAFDLLVQITRLVDGSRRISHITEVLRMESEVITLQDIFLAKPPDEDTAFGGGTRLLSPLGCTGLKPHFLDKMAAHGVALQPNFFDEDQLRLPRRTWPSRASAGSHEPEASHRSRSCRGDWPRRAGRQRRRLGQQRRNERVPGHARHGPDVGAELAGPEAARERAGRPDRPDREPRRGEVRRPRDRPFAVDAGRAARACDRGGTQLRRLEAGGGPGRRGERSPRGPSS